MLYKGLFAAAIVLAASAYSARAQGLTDEQILDRFQIQRDAYTAVRTGKGATRGLTIVTVEDYEPTAPSVDTADGGPTMGTAPEGDTASVEVAGTDTLPTTDDGSVSLTEVAADQLPAVDPTQVGRLPEDLEVNVHISFDYDSATIKADQQPVLDQMCRVMKASDIKLFRIMGHTDSAGSDAYNEKLSLLRAEEVKRRLVSDCGIAATRLDAIGLGERFPANTSDPKAPQNRRVEFQALS
ncbi:MAG: OmpA family protein [Paracoccaceae bacterium]